MYVIAVVIRAPIANPLTNFPAKKTALGLDVWWETTSRVMPINKMR